MGKAESDRLTQDQIGVRRPVPDKDIFTMERCYVQELEGSGEPGGVSVAKARVEPGVTTQLHLLRDTDERYLVLRGRGTLIVGGRRLDVQAGDEVLIPANIPQQVENTGKDDLEFFCVCTPQFQVTCYEPLE